MHLVKTVSVEITRFFLSQFLKKIPWNQLSGMSSFTRQSLQKTTEKNISWNQLFSKFFTKSVTFTKFLPKKCEREFPQFPHSAV